MLKIIFPRIGKHGDLIKHRAHYSNLTVDHVVTKAWINPRKLACEAPATESFNR